MMAASVKRIGLLVVTIVTAGVAPASAQRIGIIATSAPEAPVSGGRLGDALEAVASDRGTTPIRDPFADAAQRIADGAVRKARLSSFARASQLLEEGWRNYLRVQYQFAASRLGSARQEAETLLDLPGGLELYAEISLRLGAVKLELSRRDEAAADFRVAAILDPDRSVTDDEFKRSVVNEFDAARAFAVPRARRTIAVAPVDAQIHIDGKFVGRSPIAVELDEGLHAVVVRAPGHRPLGQAISVVAGQPDAISLQMELDPMATALAAGSASLAPGTDEESAQIAGDAISIFAELDGLMLAAVVWRRKAPALLGQWCQGAPLRCGGVVEIGFEKPDDLTAATRQLWRRARDERRRFPPLLPSDVRLTEAERAPGAKTGGGKRRSWWKNPWLWLGTAGAVLTITTVVVLTGDEDIAPAIGVTPCEFAACPQP
jgi:hypothetical protein